MPRKLIQDRLPNSVGFNKKRIPMIEKAIENSELFDSEEFDLDSPEDLNFGSEDNSNYLADLFSRVPNLPDYDAAHGYHPRNNEDDVLADFGF